MQVAITVLSLTKKPGSKQSTLKDMLEVNADVGVVGLLIVSTQQQSVDVRTDLCIF